MAPPFRECYCRGPRRTQDGSTFGSLYRGKPSVEAGASNNRQLLIISHRQYQDTVTFLLSPGIAWVPRAFPFLRFDFWLPGARPERPVRHTFLVKLKDFHRLDRP